MPRTATGKILHRTLRERVVTAATTLTRRRRERRMQAILAVTVPFFALVLPGRLRRRPPPACCRSRRAIGGLNTFVLFFALPCMLYRFGAGTADRAACSIPR